MRSIRLPLSAFLGLCILGLTLTGCTDQMLVDEPEPAPEPQPEVPTSSKVLYPHLFDDPASPSTPSKSLVSDLLPGLIVGFHDASYTPQKFLQRYRFFQRYDVEVEVLDGVFNGIAIQPDISRFLNLRWTFDLLNFLGRAVTDTGIAWIAPDVTLTVGPVEVIPGSSNHEVTPWGVEHIGAESPVDASGVDLYVIDTGVQSPDVAPNAHLNFSTSAGHTDRYEHGTHVAGIAAAQHNTTGVLGVAPHARVFNVKVFNDDGAVKSSTVLAAMDSIIARKQAHPDRPAVINLSLGANVGSQQYGPLDFAVEQAVQAGIVVVVAAGNDGTDASQVTPAHVASAITVGAYDPLNRFAAFSNHGPAVDILAPGVEIESLLPSDDNVRTGKMSGTSMAAPHVAGAAVRYLAQHPSATPAEVYDALLASSRAEIQTTPQNTTNRAVWVGTNEGASAASPH